MIIYYRGTFTTMASLLVSTLLPWSVSIVAPRYDSVVILACFLGSTFAMVISFVNSIWFYCCTIQEAQQYESNFQLSVKQMYAGDKLSRKETSIIPKTHLNDQKSEDVLNPSEMRQTYLSTEVSHNQTITTQRMATQTTTKRSSMMRCN